MIAVVRIVTGLASLVGAAYLVRRLPPLLSARQQNRTRRANAARYEAWRGGPDRAPDLLDAAEGEILDARLRRLAVVGIAVVVGAGLALGAPGA